MREIISLILTFYFFSIVNAQNVGINTLSPVTPMHVMSFNGKTLTLEHAASLGNLLENSIYFTHGLIDPAPTKYAGAIKTIGTGTTSARMGLFTYASAWEGGLHEQLSILNDGNVGIGTINPIYKLDVNGSARFGTSVGVNTAPTFNLDVYGTSRLYGHVGIMTLPSANYNLDVVGPVRMQNDVRVDGILNPNNALNIGNHTNVEGNLTVNNGMGVVRSVNASQMKIKRVTASFSYSGLGPGETLTSGLLVFGEDFNSVTVAVGQCSSGIGEWAKVMIVPYFIDINANTCKFKLTNVSSSSIDFSGTWEIMLIGN